MSSKPKDDVVLKGYSYSPALQGDVAIIEDFVLLLPGSASSAAQLAETASRLALATRQEESWPCKTEQSDEGGDCSRGRGHRP